MIDQLIVVVFFGFVAFVGLRLVNLLLGLRGEPHREVKHTYGGKEFYDPMNEPIQAAPQRERVCTGLCIAMRGGEMTRGDTLGSRTAIARERVPEHVYREIPVPQRVETPIPVEPDSVFAKRDNQRK